MKKIFHGLIYTFIVIALIFSFCSCKKTEIIKTYEIHFHISNSIKDTISEIGVSYYLNDECFLSSGLQHADGTLINDDDLDFILYENDFPENSTSDNVSVKFTINNKDGEITELESFSFEPLFGKSYRFSLTDNNGNYCLSVNNN